MRGAIITTKANTMKTIRDINTVRKQEGKDPITQNEKRWIKYDLLEILYVNRLDVEELKVLMDILLDPEDKTVPSQPRY